MGRRWQVLLPNAGAACVSAGDSHKFHGAASRAPWETVSVAIDDARFHWDNGDGLEIEREIHVHGSYVTISSTVGNRGPSTKAVLLVEHLILWGNLVGPETRVELSGGRIPASRCGSTTAKRLQSLRQAIGPHPVVDAEMSANLRIVASSRARCS